MARLREIVFDSLEPAKLARFWAQALDGYAVRPYDDAELARLAALGLTPETDPSVLVDGPGPLLCFQRVSQRKVTRNRLHLDVAAPDRAREVARLTALGASFVREAAGYTVLRDPEGNELCVVSE
jgi:glyoxalase superfamily protein